MEPELHELTDGARQWTVLLPGRVKPVQHRDDGPAYEHPDGTWTWVQYGLPHRDDGPASCIPDPTGNGFSYFWHRHGDLHREGGPAVELADGTRQWFTAGDPHRLDGPAVEQADGTIEWWANGERHRIDGPAVDTAHGGGRREWWVRGHKIKYGQAPLNDLYAAGDTLVLTAVLSSWTPRVSITGLIDAVRAAYA